MRQSTIILTLKRYRHQATYSSLRMVIHSFLFLCCLVYPLKSTSADQ